MCKQTAPTARSGPLSVSLDCQNYLLLLLARARDCHKTPVLASASVLVSWCKRRQSALLALIRRILALTSVLYTRASWLDSPSQPVSDKNSGIHARCNKRHHHLSGYLREQLRLFKTEIINQLTQIVSDCPTLIYLVPSSR